MDLDLLAAFVRTIETGSLTATARDLRTTQPTISKRLNALEAEVGARLLQRNTQGVQPTDEGQRYYEVARRVLQDLELAHSSLQGARRGLTGTLRINVATSLGEGPVTSLSIAFQRLHPSLHVDLCLTDRVVDLVEDRVDVAIRRGRVVDPNVVARPLGRLRHLLFATPAYLKKHGALKRPEDLAGHNFIRYGSDPEEELFTPDGPVRVRVRSNLTLFNSTAVKTAVMEGAGVGRISRYRIADELARGEAVEVLPGIAPEDDPMSAVYLASRYLPEKVRAFVAFATERFKEIPGWAAPD